MNSYEKNYITKSKILNNYAYQEIMEKFDCFMKECIYLPMAFTPYNYIAEERLENFAKEVSIEYIFELFPNLTEEKIKEYIDDNYSFDITDGKVNPRDLGNILNEEGYNGFLVKIEHPKYKLHQDGFTEYYDSITKWFYAENLDELLWDITIYLHLKTGIDILNDINYYSPYSDDDFSDDDFKFPKNLTEYIKIVKKVNSFHQLMDEIEEQCDDGIIFGHR